MRVSLTDRVLLAVGPRLAGWLIRALHGVMRWSPPNDSVVRDLHRRARPYIHAFFHDQLLMMTYSYLGRRYGRRLAVLSSRHRDGEYVARTLERFGHLMVRGSSGGGAVAGLREMIRNLRGGLDAAFAVDGPRGPRHRAQIGVVEAARLGRAPIVPVAFAASKKKLSARGTPSRCRSRSAAAFSCTGIRSSCRRTPTGA
ncbi:MAG: lysophospholipid acyltransferase family protein [Acidobacteriota bacterium]